MPSQKIIGNKDLQYSPPYQVLRKVTAMSRSVAVG